MAKYAASGWFALLVSSSFPETAWGHWYTWDPGCECWVPDTEGPTLPDPGPDPDMPSTAPDPEPAKFVLLRTGTGADGLRLQSDEVTFDHHQPDGVVEPRVFRYSTPSNFKSRADSSVNLWIVFHGGNGSSTSLHQYFKLIPHTHPTVVVYPEALRVTPWNQVTTDQDETIMWRAPKTPDTAGDVDGFRDVTFVERLIGRLLVNNPQLNANNVYVSGFSSGGTMVWNLLCYKSSLFAGFAIYSHQLGVFREGCGDGQLPLAGTTGYEILTGVAPDRYGRYTDFSGVHMGIGYAPTKPVLYLHGTTDPNLVRSGEPGCWKGGPPVNPEDCAITDDPLYYMDFADYDTPDFDLDDAMSVDWLLDRHQLSSQPSSTCTVLDVDASADSVVTQRLLYSTSTGSSAPFIPESQPVAWYEMQGAGHTVPALSKGSDFEASRHTQSFFEERAGMLPGGPSTTPVLAFLCAPSSGPLTQSWSAP